MSNCLTMKEYYHPKFIKQAYGDLTLLNIGDEEVISQICSSGLNSFYDSLLKQDPSTEDISENSDNIIEKMTNPGKKKVQMIKDINKNIKLPQVPMKPKVQATKVEPAQTENFKQSGGKRRPHRRPHKRPHRRHRNRPVVNNYYGDYSYDYPYYYPFFSYFYDDGYYYPRPTTYVDEKVYENNDSQFFDKNMKYIIIIALIIVGIVILNKTL